MKNLATTYSPTLLRVVPSAMKGLTSEFGMGISPSLWSPSKKFVSVTENVRINFHAHLPGKD